MTLDETLKRLRALLRPFPKDRLLFVFRSESPTVAEVLSVLDAADMLCRLERIAEEDPYITVGGALHMAEERQARAGKGAMGSDKVERADVATLERVLYAVRTVPAAGREGGDRWEAELRMRQACTQAVLAMLTEARAQPAAPSEGSGTLERVRALELVARRAEALLLARNEDQTPLDEHAQKLGEAFDMLEEVETDDEALARVKENLTEARVQSAAPSATAGEYAELLARLDADSPATWVTDADNSGTIPLRRLIREAAAALRKVLGDLTEAQRDIVATAQVLGMRAKLWDLPSNEKRAVALLERAEQAEADLARERAEWMQLSHAISYTQQGDYTERPGLAHMLEQLGETRRQDDERVQSVQRELTRERERADNLGANYTTERARADELEQELAREREAHEETRKRLAWADDDKHVIADERDAARAEVERLKSELDAADKKWRGYERDYILPAFEWATNFGIDLEKAVREDKAGRNCVAILVHTMQAEADRLRGQLAETERALDQAGMRNIEDAMASQVGKLDVETLGRIIAKRMETADNWVPWDNLTDKYRRAATDAASHVAQAFARALLTDGAVDALLSGSARSAHLRTPEERAKASIRELLDHAGLHVAAEPAAEPRVSPSDVDRARTMTEELEALSARIRAAGAAEGRPCPVDVHEVGWEAECGLGYEVVEGIRVPDLHEVNLMAQTIVWLVDEVRRLGGGGK